MMAYQQQSNYSIKQHLFLKCSKHTKQEFHDGEVDDNQICPFTKRMRKLISTNQFDSQLKECQNCSYRLYQVGLGVRKVKFHMIKKLIGWMKEINAEALSFSFDTLEASIRICTKFLQKVDEKVSNLQLLGCVCMDIASKLKQDTIVVPQIYLAFSLNNFSVPQFQQKEAEVLNILTDVQKLPTCSNLLSWLNNAANFNMNQIKIAEQSIFEALRDSYLLQQNSIILLVIIIKLIHENNNEKPVIANIADLCRKLTQ